MQTIQHPGPRRIAAWLLLCCLTLPSPAFGWQRSDRGKQYFKAGLAYETAGQWDLAALEFARAIAAAPDNAEYRLHYLRARQSASVLYTQHGDVCLAQGDRACASSAYRQAADFNPQNELARLKLNRLLEAQQQAMAATANEPLAINIAGNVKPPATLEFAAEPSRPEDQMQTVSYKNTGFKLFVASLASQLNLSVVLDETVNPGVSRQMHLPGSFSLLRWRQAAASSHTPTAARTSGWRLYVERVLFTSLVRASLRGKPRQPVRAVC
jgi:tetratricopeptide (TPR) repeat protein